MILLAKNKKKSRDENIREEAAVLRWRAEREGKGGG